MIIAFILLERGLHTELPDTGLGYGAVNSETTVHFYGPTAGKLIPIILIANLPQALLSFLYLTYNALFTCMLLAEEWSGFAHQRKSLRVSCPVGKQRSTYWLQPPNIYSLPLLVMSAMLHWLVSQSLFLVRVAVEFRPEPLVQFDWQRTGRSFGGRLGKYRIRIWQGSYIGRFHPHSTWQDHLLCEKGKGFRSARFGRCTTESLQLQYGYLSNPTFSNRIGKNRQDKNTEFLTPVFRDMRRIISPC